VRRAGLTIVAFSLVLYFGITHKLSAEIHWGPSQPKKVKSHEIPSRKISDLTIAVSSNGGSNC